MTRTKKALCLFLCLAMLLSMAACRKEPAQSTGTVPSAPAAPDYAALYDQAKADLETAPALELTVTLSEIREFNSEVYRRELAQTVSLRDLDTDAPMIYVEEAVTQGDLTCTSTEYYDGAAVYLDFDGALYRCDMTAEDYLARLLPMALLDTALYGEITGNGTELTFSAPTGVESWAMAENAVLTQASGTASLSPDGALTATGYTAAYELGALRVQLTAQVLVQAPEDPGFDHPAPADGDLYTSLQYIDAPKALALAEADIRGIEALEAAVTETMLSDALGTYLTRSVSIAACGSGEDLMAKADLSTSTTDAEGITTAETFTALFRDGTLTVTDGSGQTEASDPTPEQMRELLMEQLTGSMLPHADVTKAKISDLGSLYLLELRGSDGYAQSVYEALCEAISPEDPAVLDSQSSAYSVREMEVYLSIDKCTGFPAAYGFSFTGRHTMDGSKYDVSYEASISFELGSSGSYETITGELLPDAEPETKAAPLFYHVTGTGGQELWLLGTIHVGDDRTAFLPQQIYDAFDAADALAVEVDILDFEDRLLTDKKLITQYSMASVYINGSTLKDHVDQDIYSRTIKLSKAMGIYVDALDYFKAGAMYSYLSDYFNRHIPEYQASKGVDRRLLTMAKDCGKTILEIEDGLDQLKMFLTCSEDLQEYLLESTLDMDGAQYHDGTAELYEAWCGGDEATLQTLLADDLSDATQEELALYEEYDRIMMTSRNALMLQKAVEYLESGDTVFYAVGTAHVLDADNGLVNALRDAGYTVEPVSYEA